MFRLRSRVLWTASLVALALASCAHQKSETPHLRQQYLMGTTAFVESQELEPAEISSLFKEMKRVEALLSTYDPSTPVSQLNQKGELHASQEFVELIELAKMIQKDTGGLFDLRVGQLVEDVYQFKSATTSEAPQKKELLKATAALQGAEIEIQGQKITLAKGVKLDFGGIGKGYGVWRARQSLAKPLDHLAIGIAGDIYCEHTCKLEIENPFAADKSLSTESSSPELDAVTTYEFQPCAKASSISTSGHYRNFISSPKTNHLLHPKTGRPQSNTASITVVTRKPTPYADAMATALAIADATTRRRLAENAELSYFHIDPQGKTEKGPNFESYFCSFNRKE